MGETRGADEVTEEAPAKPSFVATEKEVEFPTISCGRDATERMLGAVGKVRGTTTWVGTPPGEVDSI